MSMHAIDLQFAVQKNDEAGIRQNQLMQKPRHDETILEIQAEHLTELERGRSGKLEESARANIKDQRRHDEKQPRREVPSREMTVSTESSSGHQPDHPYKGHHIDLLL